MFNLRIVFISFIIISIFSCNQNEFEDASVKPVSIQINRFDKDLALFDCSNWENSETKMVNKYGEIYSFYIETLLGIGAFSPKTHPQYYKNLFCDFLKGEYKAMNDTTKKYIEPHIPEIEKELSSAYSLFLHHFPKKKKPIVYSFFISPMGANPSPAFSYGNDTIGINWFNYYGSSFSLYPAVSQGLNYTIEWNQRSYITRNIMLVEYNLLSEKNETYDELIYNMIEQGKKFYTVRQFLPKVAPEIIFGYTPSQYKWCEENELQIWSYLIDNKLLYSLDIMDVKRYAYEGPTTPGMPSESPGMVGAFIGYKIVDAFMSKNKMTLEQLVVFDPKIIYKKSGYNPKK